MNTTSHNPGGSTSPEARLSRRRFLVSALSFGGATGALLHSGCLGGLRAETFIARAATYRADLGAILTAALREMGVDEEKVRGTSVLLKPNLVETSLGKEHINTHPLVVRGALEAFLRLGASRVIVGDGPGHKRDSYHVLEESGMGEVLFAEGVPFIDLNYERGVPVANLGGRTGMKQLTFPSIAREADWIVSMPKLKTHHWVGATLAMKNLFGVMPSTYYGWPKNVLHQYGIENSILDINATLRPHLAIVDGIVGMEGDGPIMGTPRHVGALVVGTNFPAVDATCARIMGLRPERIRYLRWAAEWLGPIRRGAIEQRGESIRSVQTDFALLDYVPAQRVLR